MTSDETAFGDLLLEPLRNGLTRPKRVRGSGVKMVNMGELFSNRLIGDIPMERVPLNERNPERDLLREQDLLFARQSIVAEGAGKVSIFEGASEAVTFESHLIRARVDPERADPRWLFYFFESPLGRDRMRSIVNQVAAAGIRGSDLLRLPIPRVGLKDQRRAAALLKTLDDKIEGNRRLASTLEKIVAVLFKASFVDFVGHDEFVESDFGPIPRGWRALPLGELSSTERDFTKGADDRPYIGLDDMPRGSTVLAEWKTVGAPTGQSARFAAGDILFGKLRPYFRKVGVALIDGRCSTEILVLRPDDPSYHGFLLGHVASQRFIDHCVAVSRGTRMPRAEWKDANTYLVAVPPPNVATAFNSLTSTLYELIRALVHESRTLKAARDRLLPKLLTGQVQVADDTERDAEVV